MKIGPIPNFDCLPFYLDVDEDWLRQELDAHPDLDAVEIICRKFAEDLARDFDRLAEEMYQQTAG